MSDDTINQRSQHILKILIERYILDGQPVSSRVLVENQPLALSPATVRHIMADLEERGYLSSPHTSAGRIPTTLGYRFFVNSLLTVKPPGEPMMETFANHFKATADKKHLLQRTSSLLSSISQLAAIVSLPRQQRLILRQVEFLPLSHHRLLAILVVNEQEVQNRIIKTERDYSRHELENISNYITQKFTGFDLKDVRPR